MRQPLATRRLAAGLLMTALVAVTSALLGSTANAATAARADAEQQFAGLFMQSCLAFTGDPVGLRAWATRTGLPPVPDQARAAFLHGASGQVFDGSSDAGRFVLVSSEDGLCSVATEQAMQPVAIEALETDLQQSGIAFRLVIERADATIDAIHDREYLATRNGRSWRILLATVQGDSAGEAMLTAAPE